jgi:ribulose-bisphosphate carboxylase large chain
VSDRFAVTYRVRGDAAGIAARAQAIAVEQSVEMPLEAIDEPAVLADIVGQVEDIADLGNGIFAVRIGLATATVGTDAGQFLNMVFGNTSLHEDVVLQDVEVPPGLASGPAIGIAGLRERLGVFGRAFTGSALKPQGLPPDRLAALAERLALGGLDFIKDDHGLADQAYSPSSARIPACAAAIAQAARDTGHPTRYIPSITGDLDAMRAQLRLARDVGLDCAMVVPMIAGFPNIQALRREFPDIALVAHPSMGGAARIAPELLIGSLFPLIGADAVIFPNHGGRFGYSPETCRRLAANARRSDQRQHAALPVPAGGMTLARTRDVLDFYGADTMLLIGGNLLMARDNMTAEAAAFARAVTSHDYNRT